MAAMAENETLMARYVGHRGLLGALPVIVND
jgi:hypothetical protein